MKKNAQGLKGLFIVMFLAVATLAQTDVPQIGAIVVGKGPEGVAFDGTSIWVANQFSNSVTKLRASDGAVLGTFAVGKRPIGVAFDGASIWVTNQFSNSVTKLRASDGAVLETFAVGRGPFGVAMAPTSAGIHVWVANFGSDTVSKL